MTLKEFKSIITDIDNLSFQLPNGTHVPSHYHVTEVGQITKNFIDCGGTVRNEERVSFQLWYSDDYDHKLEAGKLLKIISIAEDQLNLRDAEIEVEYQAETIGKYGLDYNGRAFVLTSKSTDCLAKDKCEVPEPKKKISLSELTVMNRGCSPNSGCC